MSSYSHAPYSHSPGPPANSGANTPSHPAVPEYPDHRQDPQFALPAQWHYTPHRPFWESKALRAGTLFTLLALCGVIILALVRQRTGTEGFLVGLSLAILPVPLLIGAFLWLDRVEPNPWRNVIFAFAWGACAATLVAILANRYATELLATTFTATPDQTDSWGATFVAPLVEETAKGLPVLFLFLFRRRDFTGIVDGVVIAGLSATGFAFTENILYLGSAFGADQAHGASGLPSTTVSTFFVRVIMSPFAHPLFTSLTGIGFAIAATSRPGQARRRLAPLGGWLLAMALHGTWNGSASLSSFGFLAVYGVLMVPLFSLLIWLAVWSRSNELKTIRTQLPVYALAGWLTVPEPVALGSMRARSIARAAARRVQGEAAARTVREYQSFATSLAFLRARAARGNPDPDFISREQELLHHLWQRKSVAQPALAHAALVVRPPYPPQGARPRWPPYPHNPYAQPQNPYTRPSAPQPSYQHPHEPPYPYGHGDDRHH